jgi:hypothetical protein
VKTQEEPPFDGRLEGFFISIVADARSITPPWISTD